MRSRCPEGRSSRSSSSRTAASTPTASCSFPTGREPAIRRASTASTGRQGTRTFTRSAIPEYFGDVMTVNGKSWPYFEVQPRRYRFRVVNASNARFLRMQLFEEAKTGSSFNGIATLFTDPKGVGVPGPSDLANRLRRGLPQCSHERRQRLERPAPVLGARGALGHHRRFLGSGGPKVHPGQHGRRSLSQRRRGGRVVAATRAPGPHAAQPERARALRDDRPGHGVSRRSASARDRQLVQSRRQSPARSVPRRSSTSNRRTRTCRWTPIGSSCSTRSRTSTREPPSRSS